MENVLETRQLCKSFATAVALDQVSFTVPRGSIVGLLGRNGAGKTTLLNCFTGLVLPSSGSCHALGAESHDLSAAELARIGVMQQEPRFLGWMSVAQHLAYVASFYPRWDRDLERRLIDELDLEPQAKVAALSPGGLSKLGLLFAVCHHPELLLLDEPASALDPLARERVLSLLLEVAREDGATVVVSSHVLHDVERVVDRVIVLERGRLRESAPLDEVKERFAEWVLTRQASGWRTHFDEPYVLRQEVNGQRARLLVCSPTEQIETFAARHGVAVESRSLNLEALFPVLIAPEHREEKR